MTTYHLDETLALAADLNPVLDEIASLSPENAIMLDQGAALAVSVIDDAMQEIMEALVAQYEPFAGEKFAHMTVNGIFKPFVAAVEKRITCIADAVNVALASEECTCEEQEEESEEAEAAWFEGWFADMFGIDVTGKPVQS